MKQTDSSIIIVRNVCVLTSASMIVYPFFTMSWSAIIGPTLFFKRSWSTIIVHYNTFYECRSAAIVLCQQTTLICFFILNCLVSVDKILSLEQNNRELISLHNNGKDNKHASDLQISSCWEHISNWNMHA
jgi:hypothetical protein